MRKETDFKSYLRGLRDEEEYIRRKVQYCQYAENKVGKDMEDISASQAEIDIAMDILKASYKQSAFEQIRAAVHKYIDFASSRKATGWVAIPSSSIPVGPFKTYADVTGLVVYENSVPSHERTLGLCEFLRAEYDKIRDFARDVLQNIWQVFPPIPVYLSKEQPEEIFHHDRKNLMKKIRVICKKCDREYCAPDCPAFDRIMEEMVFTCPIRGKYYHGKEPHIVLYFKNFPKPCDLHEPEFITAIAKTLAHEYLHYLHDCYVKNVVKKPFDDKRLSEALADFFGVLYALKQKYIVVAENRYKLWQDLKETGWPYSYALKFLEFPYKSKLTCYSATEIENAKQKFRDVFQNTNNPGAAFKILVS